MTDSKDPFEIAFFDYLEGSNTHPIIVHNNKGDDEIMPIRYFFRDYAEMPELEKKALELCIGHILDIGAGSGCHSLTLQSNGKDVTALDIRPGFVEVMKKQGLRNVIMADILTFEEGKYDTLLMLMNGIGFTQTLDGLKSFLRKSRNILAPGGQMLLDSTDLLYLYQQEDGSVQLDLNEGYYGEVVYQVEYKDIMGVPFKWLFVDYSNLSFIAEECGFISELLFEDENHNYLARLY